MFDLNFYANIAKWCKILFFSNANILNRQYEHDLYEDSKGINNYDQFIHKRYQPFGSIGNEMSIYCCHHQFYFNSNV